MFLKRFFFYEYSCLIIEAQVFDKRIKWLYSKKSLVNILEKGSYQCNLKIIHKNVIQTLNRDNNGVLFVFEDFWYKTSLNIRMILIKCDEN
jgi:hypothetical protein